jgi:L-ascorbate metabolism protein UlaG (beta-lactamase superfamily)
MPAVIAPWAVTAALLASPPAPPAPLKITYLANEGVLVEGPCTVLVDALLRDSLGSYARHPADVQERLETARPPFDRARLALATHYHLDHWDPGAIARFLRSNAAAVFASTPEATAMMPRDVADRAVALGAGRATVEASGARVQAIPLAHRTTPHLAYRIDCGGRVLAHLGDAGASEENFARLLAAGPVEVALVPWWWLADAGGLAFLRERWRPRHVVAFHLGADDDVEAARAALPGAWVAVRQGETRTY